MRKRVSFLLCCVMCLALALPGCSGSDSSKEGEKEEEAYADEDFVADMAKGLEARWKLNNEDEANGTTAAAGYDTKEYADLMEKYIDAELEYDEKYTNEKFEDSNLQELAIRYINLLKEHKDICDYIPVDYEKYDSEFQDIYNERSKIMSTLVSDYGMTVSDQYEDMLKEFMTNATLVEENEDKEAEIEEMVASLKFEVDEDESFDDWKTYRAVIENTTSTDFEDIGFVINLLDKDGIILSSEYASVSSFNQGAKAQLEFSTDKDFDSYEVTVDYWN